MAQISHFHMKIMSLPPLKTGGGWQARHGDFGHLNLSEKTNAVQKNDDNVQKSGTVERPVMLLRAMAHVWIRMRVWGGAAPLLGGTQRTAHMPRGLCGIRGQSPQGRAMCVGWATGSCRAGAWGDGGM